MTWQNIKRRIQLFDTTGMDPETVKTLKLLIVAVAFGMVCFNVTGGIAMTGYLKELGASDFVYGLLMALGPIANAFQFVASYFLEKSRARRRMFLVAGFVQRLCWLPFGLVPFFVPMGQGTLRLWIAGLLILVTAVTGPFMNMAFNSLCADVVPLRIRGRYFATRSQVSTLVGIVGGLVVGYLLDRLPGFTGYAVVFAIAGIFGTADVFSFLFMKMPEMKPRQEKGGMLSMMREVVRDRNYMKLVWFVTAWSFAVQICNPFFNVYMRESLHMTNTDITLLGQITSSVFMVLVVTRWGRALDQFGNKPVVYLAATLATINPLMWTFIGPGMLWAVFLVHMITGSIWCAIDLGVQNLFMGQAPEKNRSMFFAVYFIFTQLIGVALANAVGGFLLDNLLAPLEGLGLRLLGFELTRYNYLFLLSAALRMLSVALLLPRVREEGAQEARDVVRGLADGLKLRRHMIAVQLRRRQARKLYEKLSHKEGR